MSSFLPFEGFPRKGLEFFRNLRENNNKEWFEAHRADYDEHGPDDRLGVVIEAEAKQPRSAQQS